MAGAPVDGLPCENLLVGVTGSVGVIALPQYLLYLRRHVARNVRVMMSEAAQRFITPYTLELFSENRVFVDMFESDDELRVPHIQLARWADLVLILPATANMLGKLACGLCDDLISATVLAGDAPVVIVPSMNERMWRSKVVQLNVERAQEVGYYVLEPGTGIEVADMKPMIGPMPPPREVADHLIRIHAVAARQGRVREEGA